MCWQLPQGRLLWNNGDLETRANTESLGTMSETLLDVRDVLVLSCPLEVTNVCMLWTVAANTVQMDRCQSVVRSHSLCG